MNISTSTHTPREMSLLSHCVACGFEDVVVSPDIFGFPSILECPCCRHEHVTKTPEWTWQRAVDVALKCKTWHGLMRIHQLAERTWSSEGRPAFEFFAFDVRTTQHRLQLFRATEFGKRWAEWVKNPFAALTTQPSIYTMSIEERLTR